MDTFVEVTERVTELEEAAAVDCDGEAVDDLDNGVVATTSGCIAGI